MKWRLNLLLILLVVGCARSTYKRPYFETSEVWQADVSAVNMEIGEWPSCEWWNIFQSEELSQLIVEAVRNNYDIKAAIARVFQARALLEVAGSYLYPQVDGFASVAVSKNAAGSNVDINGDNSTLVLTPNSSGSSSTSTPGPRTIWDLEFDASYVLDIWGKNQYGVEAAFENMEASISDRDIIQLTIISTVANTYFQILSLMDRIKIAEETIENQREVLRVLNARFRLGAASKFDVSQQETQLNIVISSIPPLEELRDQSINALAVLTGRLPEDFDFYGRSLKEAESPNSIPGGLPSELLLRNPNIRKSEFNLMAANANIEVARAAFFPEVLLTGREGWRSNKLSNLFTPQHFFYQFAASVMQTIFDGGYLLGEYRFAKQVYCEMLYIYYQSIIVAFREVENSLIAIEKSLKTEKAKILAVDSAKETYRLSQIQFMNGLIDTTTVLINQRTLLTARDDLNQTQLSKFLAFVSLYIALGGGWDCCN